MGGGGGGGGRRGRAGVKNLNIGCRPQHTFWVPRGERFRLFKCEEVFVGNKLQVNLAVVSQSPNTSNMMRWRSILHSGLL